MALLSRRPLRDLRVRPLNEAHAIEATLDHEGAEVTLLCVHPAPPAAGLTPSHLSALGKILAWMREHRAHPALVLGDFNSTPYSEFAHAAREHMDDAHELAGPWGLGHTWPNEGLVYPPARLDHVFVSRSLGVRLTRRGLAAGSDHQPVIADVVLRDGP